MALLVTWRNAAKERGVGGQKKEGEGKVAGWPGQMLWPGGSTARSPTGLDKGQRGASNSSLSLLAMKLRHQGDR